jgi:Uma2 family endonuclease
MDASPERPGSRPEVNPVAAMTVLDPVSSPQVRLETQQPPSGIPGEPPQRWKWTGDDLIRMGEAGLLPPEARFELLGGEIYQLMAPGPLHAFLVDLIGSLLERLAGAYGFHVREEKPIRLNEEYDPQPDVAVVRGRGRDYRDRFPGPDDVLLVIEVADSSLQHDRELKLPAYAAAGIPECWLVNLPEQQVEVYQEPAGPEYRLRRLYRSGEVVEPSAMPGAALAASELLGEPEPAEVAGPATGE